MDLKTCAKALCNKLVEIERHPSYHSVFLQAANHGFSYSGPNYSKELADLLEKIGEEENMEKVFMQDRDCGDEK